MTNKELVHSVLLSIASMLLFLGVTQKIGVVTEKFGLITIMAGLIILYFRKELAKKIPFKTAALILVQTFGLILISLGLKNYMEPFTEQMWVIFIIIGALLFNYSATISKAITDDEGPEQPASNSII